MKKINREEYKKIIAIGLTGVLMASAISLNASADSQSKSKNSELNTLLPSAKIQLF